MAKYRKKPVVIDAFQWDGVAPYEDWPEWLKDAYNTPFEQTGSFFFLASAACLSTLEGNHNISLGDYIIRGDKGELYACKPDIFAMTYEPAD